MENTDCNKLKDTIVSRVRDMRRMQKDYFRTRSANILASCKEAERDVDRLLKELDELEEKIRLPELF